MNNALILFFCSLLILGCKQIKKEQMSRVDALPYFEDASFMPKWISPNSKKLESFHTIPDFKFTNQNGETITQEHVANKIYVVDFFFTTCPGICPMMTANMFVVQEEFKNNNDVLLLSHSVTPTIDSVSVLKQYALDKGVGENWHLLTGNKKEIYDLGRKWYFVEESFGEVKPVDDFLHTENFVLVDKKRHIRGIYNGLNRASIAQLIIDVKALQRQSVRIH
jgi:protein SCO1/2